MIETVRGTGICEDAVSGYLRNLVNLFFKILPLRESEQKTLVSYMQSLQIELLGCEALLHDERSSAGLVSLVSILQYLLDNQESNVAVYKREVFKAIGLCNKLARRYEKGESA